MFGRSHRRVERQPSHYWPFSHLRRVPSAQFEPPSSWDIHMDAIRQIHPLTRQLPWWNFRARWRQRYLRRRQQANPPMLLSLLTLALLDTQHTTPLHQQINTMASLQQLLGFPSIIPAETLADATTTNPLSQETHMLTMLQQLLAELTSPSIEDGPEVGRSAEPASVQTLPAPAHHHSTQVLHQPEIEPAEESPRDLPMTAIELSPTMATESRPSPMQFPNGELDILDEESQEWMKNVLHVDFHRPTLSQVEVIDAFLRKFKGVPIGEWPFLQDDRDRYIVPDRNQPGTIRRLPYHDQEECIAAMWDFNLGALKALSDMANDTEDVTEVLSEIRPLLEEGLTGEDLAKFETTVMLAPHIMSERLRPSLSLLAARNTEEFAKGQLYPILLWLDRLPATNAPEPDENGYTCVFNGGTEVSLEELHNELNVPNTEETEKVADDVVTVAVSYSPCLVGSSTTRISLSDVMGIAEFIKKSHKTKLRFWIDSKLPPADSSFQVWLKRHVRPFAKYLTLVCPSADASSGFWLTGEKLIADRCKGYFSFEENGIYLRNSKGEPPVDLDRWMLKLLLRIEDPHPGMDRGETVRWVMQYFASEYNCGGPLLGMKFEEQGEEDEANVTSAIQRVVRKDGPLKIPIRSGEGWNKKNPLVERNIPGQNFEMSHWLGLAKDEDKLVVYFLLYEDLFFVKMRSVVVLRVTLTRPYDLDGTVCIENKELVELSSEAICKLKGVTAAWLCDWE